MVISLYVHYYQLVIAETIGMLDFNLILHLSPKRTCLKLTELATDNANRLL